MIDLNYFTVENNRMGIVVNLNVMMAKRRISVNELSEKVGLTPGNISLLKNGRARGIRFSTLSKICIALECQPADILEFDINAPDDPEAPDRKR